MIAIRKVQPEDNFILATIIRTVFEELNAPRLGTVYSDPMTDNLFELFQEVKACLWVAEIDGEIVGCCGIFPTAGLPSHCTELVKFYLSAKARGKGIGRELMARSIISAKEFGYSSIYLESLPAFGDAISIYKKQGFETLTAPMGESGHPGCDVWMVKELA
ncbi:MAG: GNAT family N-acetyltransferase [Sphingobacterium sp.]|jgi:putative acetyltransferase|uniref:GNAT family N-acetyltransferase n=1 Tax=Sphingobacterium sp. TaxID=341027 RepID=UPI002842F067|nr:GNAT family N-acetyltransferase [Sphingobacterium sp.]MDR3006964.1 GNAT family N-acetyltransferase [Sphingobacterium sp.]